MGTGYSTGSSAAYDAAKMAIESPLLDNISIDGAMGVLVHFDIHPEYPLNGIGEAMDIIYDSADEDADVIFGTTTNENMEIDEVKITIVATGFEDQSSVAESTPVKTAQKTLLTEPVQPNNLHTLGTKRIVVGQDYTENEDILDVPTFLRKQMD
jgi:cell division protein FtsZ